MHYHSRVPKAAANALRIAVSLGLAALLLWVFFRNLDLRELGTTLSAAHPGWLGLALAITLVNFPHRSWRWTRLLHHVQRVPQREAFSATCIGFAATVLLPARAGEIVRPAVLSRRTGLPFAPALASVAVERLIDLVTVVLLFVVYALGGWEPENLSPEAHGRLELLRRSAYLVGAATLAVFAGLAERRTGEHDDFWSWRDRMYRVASRVTPAQLQAIAAQLYVELLQGGYTQVCEFHYLQHDRDGRPYDTRGGPRSGPPRVRVRAGSAGGALQAPQVQDPHSSQDREVQGLLQQLAPTGAPGGEHAPE